MKPAVTIALAFTLQQGTPVEPFTRLPRLAVRPFLVSHAPRSFKRQRHPRRRAVQPQLTEDSVWEGPPLLELDVVEYQRQGEDMLELGSYIGDGKIQPLLTREESGPDLFFHDEEAQPVSVSSRSCRIVRVLDQVHVSQRIVEDRVKNPHGEEAEESIIQIGCGVVGGAYAKAYKHHGFEICGFDVVPAIIEKMKVAGIPCCHPDDCPDDLNPEIVLLSVPTPLIKETQRLDMKYVWSTIPLCVKLIEQSTGKPPIFVIRSTVPPGTTKKWMAALKEKTSKPFHVAFQPEFLRAVSCEEDARAPWQVVFGYIEGEEDVKARMSNAFLEFVNRDESKLTVLNIAEAEFMKLVHNYANGLKISFANCIYGLANELDPTIDAQKVLYLVSSTAECFLSRKYALRVGAPYGGVCLPKDVPELTSLAPDGSVFREFLSGTGKINDWIASPEAKNMRVTLEESPNWVSPESLVV